MKRKVLGLDLEGTLVYQGNLNGDYDTAIPGGNAFLQRQIDLGRDLLLATIAEKERALQLCGDFALLKYFQEIFALEDLDALTAAAGQNPFAYIMEMGDENMPFIIKNIRLVIEAWSRHVQLIEEDIKIVYVGDHDLEAGFSYPGMPVVIVPAYKEGFYWPERRRVDLTLDTFLVCPQPTGEIFDTIFSAGILAENPLKASHFVQTYHARCLTHRVSIRDQHFDISRFEGGENNQIARVIWEQPVAGE